ncbi:papain-like cysteine peptidase [Bacillus licheniformis]|uniref:papain-like cysteine peptidase n=1 Tax=Bacillus licheniformis TaxID=1402 RepID=UPI000FFE1E17|nr:papain-like cysteine peptidase [Bacillus licheniformis]QAT53502.1 peptidase [Bacillus licheniformis]
MNLKEIQGEYDAVFSLGHLCLTALQLRKMNKRPYAGPFDWVGSSSLPDLCRLIRNRFEGFMDPINLRVTGYSTGVATKDPFISVTDDHYCIDSAHDFKADRNTLDNLATYHEVIEKFNRRFNRFLEKTSTAQRALFVRTSGTMQEAKELEEVLSDLVTNDFSILLINHTNVSGIVENHWPLKNVCAVELPDQEIWQSNDPYWSEMFQGITIR